MVYIELQLYWHSNWQLNIEIHIPKKLECKSCFQYEVISVLFISSFIIYLHDWG